MMMMMKNFPFPSFDMNGREAKTSKQKALIILKC